MLSKGTLEYNRDTNSVVRSGLLEVKDMADANTYTIEEVAKRLRVSKKTILREIKKGKLSVQKAGRKYLIDEDALDRYLHLGTSEQPLEEKCRKFLDESKSEMVTLLQKLISLNSDSNTLGQEGRVAYFIKEFLDKHDIRCVVYNEGDAVVLRASYGYANDGILLDCPLDTTHSGDISKWTYPPFEGVVKDGKMFGRGAADAKGGIVTQIYTLLALKQFVPEEKIRVEVVFDGGEQNGEYLGMQLAIKKGLPVTAGIIGYSSNASELQIGARGYHRFTLTSHGKASHTGSRNHFGVNAIEKLCDCIYEIKQQKLPESKNAYFPFGSRITFSMIGGGEAINIVPDTAWTKVDVRTTPDLTQGWLTQFFKNHLFRMHKNDPLLNVNIHYDLGKEGYVLDKKEKIVQLMLQVAKEELKHEPKLVATGPAHIGNLLYEHNIPVIIWGPRGGNVHSYDEYIELESLPQTSYMYISALLKFFEL